MTGLLAGRSILVVEDEMLLLMHIERALTDAGCTATSAATIDDALTLLDGTSFDAAMLDVNLHGEKSYPVADALALRGIPFAFSTGYGDHGERAALPTGPCFGSPISRVTWWRRSVRWLLQNGPARPPLFLTATVPSSRDRRPR